MGLKKLQNILIHNDREIYGHIYSKKTKKTQLFDVTLAIWPLFLKILSLW